MSKRKVEVGYKATHYEYRRYVRPVRECDSPATIKASGACSGCGWKASKEYYVPSVDDVRMLCSTCDTKSELLAERDAAVQHAERLAADVRAMRRSLLIIAQGRTTDAMRVASDALLDHDDRQVKP